MHKTAQKTHSPYAKYNKSPFLYSENYRRWKELTKKHMVTDTPEHMELNRAFRKTHGLPPLGV